MPISIYLGTNGIDIPLNFNTISEQAKIHVQKGRHDKAIALWNDFLSEASDAEMGSAHNNLGDVYGRKKDTVAATDQYLLASQAFERSGYPLKAIAALKKIIKIDSSRTEVYLRLGDLNARRDMIGNAVEAYLVVVRLLTKADETEAALALLRKTCILDPVNIRHRLQLATESLALGFTAQGMDETVNAIDLYIEQGNLEEAERYCRHLLDMEENFAPARDRLERIADASRDAANQAGAGGESAIDDLFAELDGMFDGMDAKSDDGWSLADTKPEPEPDPVSFGSMLEPTQLPDDNEANPTDDNAGPPDPLLGLGDLPGSTDSDFGDLAKACSEMDLRQAAFEDLDAGDFDASLEKFSLFVTQSVENGQHMEADAALKAYLAIDPDNPVGHALRLRIYEGRDPEMEGQILEHLVSLWQDQNPSKADAYSVRLAQLNDDQAASQEADSDSDDAHHPDPFALDMAAETSSDDADQSGAPEEPGPADWLTLNNADPKETQAADASDQGASVVDDRQWLSMNAESMDTPTLSLETADLDAADSPNDAADGPLNIDLTPAEDSETTAPAPQETVELTLERDDSQVTDAAGAAEDLFAIHQEQDKPALEEVAPERLALYLEADTAEDADPISAAPDEAISVDTDVPLAVEVNPAPVMADSTPQAVEPATPATPVVGFDLEDALAEAAFYTHQNLTSEAESLYRTILEFAPNHPEAREKLEALAPGTVPSESMTADTPATSVAPIEPVASATPVEAADPATPTLTLMEDTGMAVPPPPSSTSAVMHVRDDNFGPLPGDTEFLDFANDIQDAIESQDDATNLSEEAQLDDILLAFREGIKDQVDDGDSETHYDLGTAYREMGLMEEAVGEFQMAIKGALRYADACIALSECFSDMGRDHLALDQLRKALARTDCKPEQWIALTYELATVLESCGETQEARSHYEQVYARDITFRQVAQKVAALG